MISKSLFAADRRHHICLRDAKEHCRPLGPPSTGRKKLRVLNPILGLYQRQPTGRCSEVRVKMCLEWSLQSAARTASYEGGCLLEVSRASVWR